MHSPSHPLLRAPGPVMRAACAALFVVLVANLFVLGAQPFAVGLLPAPWDKFGHLALYGGLAVLLTIALRGRHPFPVFLVVCGIGVADELFQASLPGRHADWGDFWINVLGASLGVWAVARLVRKG